RIACLRPRRHGAELDVAESQRAERVEIVAVFVEAGGEPERMRESQPKTGERQIGGQSDGGRKSRQQLEAGKAHVMREFGVHPRQERQGAAGDQCRQTAHRRGLKVAVRVHGTASGSGNGKVATNAASAVPSCRCWSASRSMPSTALAPVTVPASK